ncbi:MAG: asparagine synthetase B [Candidatus Bathyarchaeia archaeon]
MRTLIAVLDKKCENATDTVSSIINTLEKEQTGNMRIATIDTSQRQNGKTAVAVGYVHPETCTRNEMLTLKLKSSELMLLIGRLYPVVKNAAAIENMDIKLKQDSLSAAKMFLSENEGDYVFIIVEPEKLIAGRAPIGLQPLYYGENGSIVALSSCKKALWMLNIGEIHSFPPGYVAVINRKGAEFMPVKALGYTEPKPLSMEKAAETLRKLLEVSVRNCVGDLRDVAVAFSGGLDSSLLAFLAEKCGVNVYLIYVSLRNQQQKEIENAKKIAEELRLPFEVHFFSVEDVEKVVPKVVEIIEVPNPLQVSIGVPFYLVAEKAADAGFKVLLAGQGADELFGGYQRYVRDYLLHGESYVKKVIFNDVTKLHENNIDRDVKICNYHDVQLRLPFASYTIADFALKLPIELKIEKKNDTLRKLVLRKTAESVGLPMTVVNRPKKAIQYSTGIYGALEKIASKQGKTVRDYLNTVFFSFYDQISVASKS